MAETKPRDQTAGKLDALVRLLADDDHRIRQIAQENLSAEGQRALEVVQDRALNAEDPEVRRAAKEFLRETGRNQVMSRWSEFTAGWDVDLQDGAVLIARSEYPDLDAGPYLQILDGYAAVLARRLSAVRSLDVVIDRINGLLFKEVGYRGNHQEYYDPRNSYLNDVMTRKLGIPISLSAIYLLVTRRLGLKIEGVGMPGHFLLRYRIGRKSFFIDPFHQGRRWTYQDCMTYLESEGFGFHEDYLRAASDREILLRMLENLLRIYHSREDQDRLNRVNRMVEALRAGRAGKK